jgi:hypothetical protein
MLRPGKVVLASLTLAVVGLGSVSRAPAQTIDYTYSITGTAALLSPPPVSSFQVMGTGPVTPFGDSVFAAVGVVDFSVLNPDGSNPAAGTFQYTFAGGESYRGTFVEAFFPPDPTTGLAPFTVSETITGGTGRFTDARGSAFTRGTALFTSPTTVSFTLSGSGTITLVPEPASVLLFGTGLLGLVVVARLRRGCHGHTA